MRTDTLTINMPATGAGSATTVSIYTDKWVQFTGIAGGAVFDIEGQIDGSTYVAVVTGVSTNGIVEVPANVLAIRLNRTTTGSGTIVCTFIGRVIAP